MSTATITTKMIAELRARTSAGMMDCKKALEEANGDLDKASEILRAKGIAKADKRAGRNASQGLVMVEVSADATTGTLVEVNCETDFVARNDSFREFTKGLLQHAVANAPVGADVTALVLAQKWHDGMDTVEESVKTMSGKTGEAMALKRVAKFTVASGVVGHYLHHNQQVGVMVELGGATGDAALALAKDIALHVASADPIAVRAEEIPADLVDRERRIAEEQVAAEGKPEAIRGKIVDGKIAKFVSERTLLAQPFVKDDTKSVAELMKSVPGASIVRFARLKVGEG